MTLELKRPVLKSNCSIFCTYKLFLRMPCLQPLLKVFISDPQAKWSEYFILCFSSGDKLHNHGFWKVWVEKAGGSSVWPGAQGEARLRGCGKWPGEGHLLQGIVRIPQERRMEPPEELHLGVQTKLLRAGVNGTEEGRSVLELEVWTELPEWAGWRVRGKVTRRGPAKGIQQGTCNVDSKEMSVEGNRPQAIFWVFGPQTNLERQEFNRAQRKEVKQAMRWKGSCWVGSGTRPVCLLQHSLGELRMALQFQMVQK